MIRPDVKPSMLTWARERAGLDVEDLEGRFPKIRMWENDEAKPTLKQLEALAKATLSPIGYLFLSEPPEETIPIPDFRTMADRRLRRPSPNLLDTIYLCQRRQSWYREFAKSIGEEPKPFVGAARRAESEESVASEMREALGFDLYARRDCSTWSDALRQFIGQADSLGILVMCSGVVLNNNHRKLDAEEFRGFSMVDDLAPLVFLNGSDSKSGQMFTLAHELAHIWLGESAIDNADPSTFGARTAEMWCNRVAAELLVPLRTLRGEIRATESLDAQVKRLTRHFKVSSLVILRRIHDAGALSRDRFVDAYADEIRRLRSLPKGTGGDFYLTQAARASKRFARALVASTLEGQTLYRDAFRLLGISKIETFKELGLTLNFGV